MGKVDYNEISTRVPWRLIPACPCLIEITGAFIRPLVWVNDFGGVSDTADEGM